MFTEFFENLRSKGLHVTLGEFLTLQEALDQGLCGSSLTQFYYVARMILVKSETDYDKFDMAFEECFKPAQRETEIGAQMLRWLDKSEMLELAHEEARAHLNQMEDIQVDKEMVEETFKQRLRDQNEEHNGGSKWVGTGGYSPYGHHGKKLGGIRVGGESMYRSAFRVAGERRYRDFRSDKTLDSRQFQMAFRRLRQLSDHNLQEKTELDIDETIRKTGEAGGPLKIVKKAPRRNAVKLMVLIDSGGSMDYHRGLVTLLFQSMRKAGNFEDVRFYYFHNAIGDHLYTSPTLSWNSRIETDWVLRNIPSEYKVLIVGDGEMAMYELYGGFYWGESLETDARGRRKMRRFTDFADRYPHIVWIHPQDTPTGRNYWNETWWELAKVFPMFPLTLDGLNAGIRKLLVSK
jgi:uncharacterized protein with von Willebrand factor type A (vWA) domain